MVKIEALLSFFEHLSHGLTALLIALVCSATLAAGYVPLRSGMDPARVESDLAILRWIQEQSASSSKELIPSARESFEDLTTFDEPAKITQSKITQSKITGSAERPAPTSPLGASAPRSASASPQRTSAHGPRMSGPNPSEPLESLGFAGRAESASVHRFWSRSRSQSATDRSRAPAS
jgi:hypothetical protein